MERGEEERKIGFAGIPDVDLNILLKLPTRDLINACRTSKYLNSICRKYDTLIWKERVANEIDEKWGQIKPEHWSWQRWYSYLKSHPDEIKLVNLLNFNIDQSIIYFITKEGDLVPGSEAFLTIEISLPRAFRSGNAKLVNYFMTKFDGLFRKYFFRSGLYYGMYLIPYLIPYDEVIVLALEHGFDAEAGLLLDYFFQEEKRYPQIDLPDTYYLMSLNIARYLGQQRKFKLFKKLYEFIIANDVFKQDQPFSVGDYFLFGLIEKQHTKDAKEIFSALIKHVENYDIFIPKLINVTREADNRDFLDFIEEYLVSEKIYNPRFFTKGKEERIIPEESEEDEEDPSDEEVFRLVKEQKSPFDLLRLASRIRKNKILYLYVAINYALLYDYNWDKYPITYFDEKEAVDIYEMLMLKLYLTDSNVDRLPKDNFYRDLMSDY